MGNIENKNIDHEPTIDLELRVNNNASETERYIHMKVDTEV